MLTLIPVYPPLLQRLKVLLKIMYYALYSTKYYLSFVSESGNKRVWGVRKEKTERRVKDQLQHQNHQGHPYPSSSRFKKGQRLIIFN
jgi:hypothetical protein